MELDQNIYSYPKTYKELKDEQSKLDGELESILSEWFNTDKFREEIALIALKNRELFKEFSKKELIYHIRLPFTYLEENEIRRDRYYAITQLLLSNTKNPYAEKVKELVLKLRDTNRNIGHKKGERHEEFYFRKHHTFNNYMCDELGAESLSPVFFSKEVLAKAIEYCEEYQDEFDRKENINDLKSLLARWNDDRVYEYSAWW